MYSGTEIEFDIVEEGEEEDEEGIKYAAQTMLAVYKYVADSIEAWSLYIRVTIHSCCCGDDRGKNSASCSSLPSGLPLRIAVLNSL